MVDSMVDRSQNLGKLDHTAQPVGSQTCWKVSFSSNSDLKLFQEVGVISESSLQLVCLRDAFIVYSGQDGGLVNLVCFRSYLVV